MAKKVEIVEVDAVGPKVLAEAIVRLDEAANKLMKSGLTRRAIYVLLKDLAGVSIGHIEMVLQGLTELKMTYTKKPEAR